MRGLIHTISLITKKDTKLKYRLLSVLNIVCLIYFISLSFSTVHAVLFDIIPTISITKPTAALKYLFIAFFLLFEMLGNLFLVMSTDSSAASIEISSITQKLKDHWKKKCELCKVRVPRRCHHCYLCGTCILKRDHHCFFLCTCIGFNNHKYFVMFCLYLGVGAVYSAFLILVHLYTKYSIRYTSLTSFVTVLYDAVYDYYIEQSISTDQLFLLILMYASLLTGLLIIGLFLWQMLLVSRGQTTFEFSHNRHGFRKQIMWNFLDVFGPYWFLTIFLPFRLPQYSLENMLKSWWSNLRPNFVLCMRPVHWKWRVMSLLNIFGSLFVYSTVWTIVIDGLYHIVPEIFGPGFGFGKLFSWNLAIQVVGNSLLFLSTKTDLRQLNNMKKRDEEWLVYCQICQSKIPPRGHHCALCNKCVLKRDHHCFFVSCCIGFHNQKYFFMFLVYACISTFYVFFLMPYYLDLRFDVAFDSSLDYFTLLPRILHKHLFIEQVDILILFNVTLMYASLSCAFFTGGLVGFQGFLIYRGQTTYEVIYGARDYDEGWKQNFLDCFGPYWYITLFLPLPLPQSHHGVYKSMHSITTDPSVRYRYELISSMSI